MHNTTPQSSGFRYHTRLPLLLTLFWGVKYSNSAVFFFRLRWRDKQEAAGQALGGGHQAASRNCRTSINSEGGHARRCGRPRLRFRTPSDRPTSRAVLLGLIDASPAGRVAQLAEPFTRLCAVTLEGIVRHRNGVSLQLAQHPGPPSYSVSQAAATVYEAVRVAFAASLKGEHGRLGLLARQMRRAGLPQSSCYGPNSPINGTL